jgi:hypothetical protein
VAATVRPVSAAIFISAVSVAIAFASLIVNFLLSHRAAVRARKPVIVFVDDPEQGCWTVKNVGNGPALNVVVAQRAKGEWFNPVRVPPLGNDSSFALDWLGRVADTGLGSSYSDFEGRRYTSTLGGEIARAYEGDRLPEWQEPEVRRYWDLPGDPVDARWGAKPSDFRA